MRLKKNDLVLVLRGKDKGKTGKILEVYPSLGKVKVDGVNISKVHRKSPGDARKRGVFEEFMPMDVSKVGFMHSSKKGRASRIEYKINAKGEKKRVLKSSGKEI